MFDVVEPPAEWVPEVPVDLEEIPRELRAVEEDTVDLSPKEELALVSELEAQERWDAIRELDVMDADEVLAAAVQAQRTVNLAQARQLFLAAQWVDLHAVLDHPQLKRRGGETLIRPGGVGTPGAVGVRAGRVGCRRRSVDDLGGC